MVSRGIIQIDWPESSMALYERMNDSMSEGPLLSHVPTYKQNGNQSVSTHTTKKGAYVCVFVVSMSLCV